ncbi:Zn-dependent protease with chaperone function-like protein [Calothrix sp. NIES-4071]|nr:Zn-dependent protease with chaperone function-like protein [Calothrix sp. NIES-4071]BAZ60924.1 Zn-dependent protease with chaperone function-like protein [Calothrix sp. NIES-4105]
MNIQQREQFDVIVQKIEKYARQNPSYYRLRVFLLALLGYAYIGFVFLLMCGGIWGLRSLVVSTQSDYLVKHIDYLIIILAIGIIRLFWVKFQRPKGLEVYRQQLPELFAIIDEITKILKAPRIHHILLTSEHNAGVLQIPRLGFLGWQQNYLLLGLPLLQSLSVEQFRSTIAHELAHLSGNHSRFSGWVYRVRRTWDQLAHNGDLFLFKSFFQWYEPYFNAYSFALARAQEYEADRRSVEICGIETSAEELINIYIHNSFLREVFWKNIYEKAIYSDSAPNGTITKLLQALRTDIETHHAVRWLGLALSQITNNDDTHPCLLERLEAMGYLINPDNTNKLPGYIEETAAEYFFGDTLYSFAAYLDEQWKREFGSSWRMLHLKLVYQRQNLTALEAKAYRHTLTPEQALMRAVLTSKFQSIEAAIPLFESLLANEPDHAKANYELGKILLQNYDGRGIDYLNKAIDLDSELVIPSCEILYGFYLRCSQPEQANKYLLLLKQYQQSFKLFKLERQHIKHTDKFLSHNLPPVEALQISEQLSNYLSVSKAYLVRKQIKIFPDKPLYVLGIIRRFVRGTGANYQPDAELIEQIKAEINLSSQVHVIIFNQTNMKLYKVITRVRDACIVSRK